MATHDIFLLSSRGEKNKIQCALSETIKEFRKKVCVSLDCDDRQLRIIYQGKEIKDQTITLSKLGVGVRESWSVHCSIKPLSEKTKVTKKPPVTVKLTSTPKRAPLRATANSSRSNSSSVAVDLTSDDETPAAVHTSTTRTTVSSATANTSSHGAVVMMDSSDEEGHGAAARSTHSRKRAASLISTDTNTNTNANNNSKDGADDIICIE